MTTDKEINRLLLESDKVNEELAIEKFENAKLAVSFLEKPSHSFISSQKRLIELGNEICKIEKRIQSILFPVIANEINKNSKLKSEQCIVITITVQNIHSLRGRWEEIMESIFPKLTPIYQKLYKAWYEYSSAWFMEDYDFWGDWEEPTRRYIKTVKYIEPDETLPW